MNEKIICAAIRMAETGKVFYGHRHDQCINSMNSELSWILNRQQIAALEKIQGFVTNESRFVDRKEGWKIALNAGQIINIEKITDREDQLLFSEDLY